MALRKISILIFLICCSGFSFLKDPFPPGFSMADMGTILWKNSMRVWQPWLPAAFMSDTISFGGACGYTAFYDGMDNFEEEKIYRVLGGLWYNGKRIQCKASLSLFNALSIYTEQTGFISFGTDCIPFIHVSIELTGTRSVLSIKPGEVRTMAETGVSLGIPLSIVYLSASVGHIVIKKSDLFQNRSDILVRAGVHTVKNRFGAQGVILELQPSLEQPVRLIFGEEIFLSGYVSFRASISTNPCFVGMGLTVEWNGIAADVSLVNNPELGWSQGFSAGYGKKMKARSLSVKKR